MATSKEKILVLLQVKKVSLCDDCISKLAGVTPRQQVYQICRTLGDARAIERKHGTCGNCERGKLVNNVSQVGKQPEPPPPPPPDKDKTINDIHHQLTQLLQKLKPQPRHVSLNDQINQLLQENQVPNYIATLMHTIRKLRNDFTKERIVFSEPVFAAFEAIWVAIQDWARKRFR